MSSKPIRLWVDCTDGLPDSEHRVRCATHFDIVQAEGIALVQEGIARHKPGALCFDFDYPDQQRLQAMVAIKKSFPRVPILMLTIEHSERLAVWAFRSRVWNYLVKPDNYACFQCHHGLAAIDYMNDVQGTSAASVLWGDATVTCITCHDPHKDEVSADGRGPNLRRPV